VIELGDGKSVPVSEQERIAVEFLKRYRAELAELGQQPGVTSFVVGIEFPVGIAGVLGLCIEPSRPLMSESLATGIRPLYYVTLQRREDQDPESETTSDT
jgi:hypothetical protein